MTDTKAQAQDAEKGVMRYTVGDREILLTATIVRRFFCSDADDLSAMAFMGYCRAHRLDPFAKEVYLSVIDGRPTIQVAYTTFMKRAERHRQYKGFKAGLVLQKDDKDAVDVTGETGVVPAPLVALQGELVPPGYKLFGGWCKVLRKDREDTPALGVVALRDYIRYTKDGKVQRMWSGNDGSKQATMIRKTSIAHGFRDAFPDEVGDMRIAEEYGDPEATGKPVAEADRPTEPPHAALPPAMVPLFERLGWNTAARVMFVAEHKDNLEAATAELEREVKMLDGPPANAETAVIVSTKADPAEPATGKAFTDF